MTTAFQRLSEDEYETMRTTSATGTVPKGDGTLVTRSVPGIKLYEHLNALLQRAVDAGMASSPTTNMMVIGNSLTAAYARFATKMYDDIPDLMVDYSTYATMSDEVEASENSNNPTPHHAAPPVAVYRRPTPPPSPEPTPVSAPTPIPAPAKGSHLDDFEQDPLDVGTWDWGKSATHAPRRPLRFAAPKDDSADSKLDAILAALPDTMSRVNDHEDDIDGIKSRLDEHDKLIEDLDARPVGAAGSFFNVLAGLIAGAIGALLAWLILALVPHVVGTTLVVLIGLAFVLFFLVVGFAAAGTSLPRATRRA